MRRNILLALASLAAIPAAGAQTVTWNDRMSETEWLRDAPEVRVIVGTRSPDPLQSVSVFYEVSENAYVAIVRVAGDGKMTILYPHNRNQRPFVRTGRRHEIQNPREGGFAFTANDRYHGYIFAIASYAPLDLSSFESRDFDRFGAYSPFTQANREVAHQPDVFIDRFAAQVLWAPDTPYNYDVDFYFAGVRAIGIASAFSRFGSYTFGGSPFSAYALCGTRFIGVATRQKWQSIYDLDDYTDFVPHPYRALCRDWYAGLACLSYLAVFNTQTYWACNQKYRDQSVQLAEQVPGSTSDVTPVNEAMIRGGLFTPAPAPVSTSLGGDPDAKKAIDLSQFTTSPTEWAEFRSIPKRATDRLAETKSANTAGRGQDASASSGTTVDQPSRVKEGAVADNNGAATRPPPAREPTRTKSTGETRDRSRPATDFGPSSRTPSRPTHDRPITTRPDPATQPTTKTTTGSGAPSRPTTTTKPPSTGETKVKPPTE